VASDREPDGGHRRNPPDPEPLGDDEPVGRRGRDPRVVIAIRELASLKSEKTIVLAMLIQVFVATFSSFLVVGLVSLYSPSSEGFQPEVAVTGDAKLELAEAIEDSDSGFRVYAVENESRATTAFDRNEVNAVLRAERGENGVVRVTATVPEGSLRTTLIVVKTKDALEELERSLRDQYAAEGRLERTPLDVPPETQASPYFGFSYTVLVPLLMFLPVFISGSIVVDSVTEELQRGTMELLRSAPITLRTIVDAKVLSTATLAPAQALLWIGLLWLNGITVVHWLPLVAMVGGISTAVVALGVGVSLLTPERRQAQFIYSSGMLVLAMAGVVLPEHPANTVAKLAIGSATVQTWLAVVVYVGFGVVGYLAVRFGVGYVDAEGL
jgi:ABC-type Na+ efflux pump permease subunit